MPGRTRVIKLILYALGLAGINVLVSLAAMLAVILFFFRGDPILAAVPAVMALPAIVLQPWFLVFFFLPGSSYAYAPLVTTLVTIVVYGWLNRIGMLERPKRLLLRFKTRRMLAVASGFVNSMPPYWWHPSITERTRILSTPDFPLHERS